jgi:energy-coupling factor transporter ATP-binding protein EcfA2
MGQILGITGNIGSGKSTFASLLCDIEPSHATYESGELIAEVADDFNRALSGELAFETTSDNVELTNQALIWFIEAISERLHTEVTWNQLAITRHMVITHPELFEKLFTYIDTAKTNPGLLEQRITADNKADYRPLLQWLGGYLVAKISTTIWYDEIFRRIARHDNDKKLVIVGGLRYPSDEISVREHGGLIVGIERANHAADTTDVTESERSGIKPDTRILNNGSLQQLQAVATELANDFIIGKLKPEYIAS